MVKYSSDKIVDTTYNGDNTKNCSGKISCKNAGEVGHFDGTEIYKDDN